MRYTVKELADLSGVSRRTLHFYDEIGLLRPASYGKNGYRQYDERALLRLQQILFYKELDFSLAEIQTMLDQPAFDVEQALQEQRVALQQRAARLHRLVATIDKTIRHVKGEITLKEQEFYEGFGEAQHRRYRPEAIERYGEEAVQASEQRWNSYSPEQKQAIIASGEAILSGIRDRMAAGHESREVQQLVRALHQHMGFFYDCSYERFAGLGRLYNEDPAFIEMYQKKYHPEMPAFLTRAIDHYCQVQQSR